jgi:uncharacterized protein DUF4926/uncharacterized protein DUF2442
MEDIIQFLDVVALTIDVPEAHLRRGHVGTVVEIFDGGGAFEVEFSDRNGRAYASLGLRPDQVMLLAMLLRLQGRRNKTSLEGRSMFKPVEVKASSDYKIWIRYSNGAEGEVDLSSLVGRGVFSLWRDYTAFQNVHLGPHGEIAWSDEVELCPDSIYLKLTGQTPEEVFPNLPRMK